MPNIFLTARLKLTLWYMLISYAMLAFFTLAVIAAYNQTFEVVHQAIIEQGRGIVFDVALKQQIASFEQNFIQRLLIFDLLIALATGLASYVLSGRTLGPIQKAMEEQQKFAADASHELRTPLANITMEIAAYQQGKKIPAEQARLLDSIQDEAHRMAGIVAGLLSLVRANHQTTPVQSVDLHQLILAVIQDMSSRFKQAKLKIDFQSTANPPTTSGYPDELRQLVIILLENALLYSHPNTQVTIHLDHQASWLRLTVNNLGPTIPNKELTKIFQRFYRGQNAKAPGTGLGLAIASSIVDHHRGNIAVASRQPQGTTFRVLLPKY